MTIRLTNIILILLVAMGILFLATTKAEAAFGYFGDNQPLQECDSVSDDGARCIIDGEDVAPTLSSYLADNPESTEEILQGVQNANIGPDGLFSCNSAKGNMSVGTLTALSSPNTYVPVFDAAVTRNTGYLVYKECVLDGMVSRYKNVATAAIAEAITKLIAEGTGNGSYIQDDPALDRVRIMNRVTAEMLKEYNKEYIHESFRDQVYYAVAEKYAREASADRRSYSPTEEASELVGKFFSGEARGNEVLSGLLAIARNPSNSPLGSAIAYNDAIQRSRVQAAEDYQRQVDNGGGIRPQQRAIEVTLPNGETATRWITTTPGSVLESFLIQALSSGFEQLQDANEVNEITGSAFLDFASLQTQVLASDSGVTGLVEESAPSGESPGGGLSFFDTLLNALRDIFGNTIANSALAIVTSALAAEREYRDVQVETVDYLRGQQDKVLAKEAQCWVDLEIAVQGSLGQQPPNLATSTIFSTAAFEALNPLLTSARQERNSSRATVGVLATLAETLSDSSSQNVQNAIIAQIDAMVAAGTLHDGSDTTIAQNALDNMEGALGPSLDATIALWATTTANTVVPFSATSTIGWCATSSAQTVQYWTDQWR